MNSMMEFVIDHATNVAFEKVSANDVVCGLISALRRVRGVVQEYGDDMAISMFDGELQDQIIISGLRSIQSKPAALSVLPANGPGARDAEAILANAVDYCLTVIAHTGDCVGLFQVSHVLLERLVEVYGSVPEKQELMARLVNESDTTGDDAIPVQPTMAYLN